MIKPRMLAAIAMLTALCITLVSCGLGASAAKISLTFRTWDANAAAAYEASFAAFERSHPDIAVKVEVTPWSTYFPSLRADISGSTGPDLFWLNNASYREYASSNLIVDIDQALGRAAKSAWSADVVNQFTLGGSLWAIPQTADGGIALFYNKKLIKTAGITPEQLNNLVWAPGGAAPDNLIKITQRLTRDSAGKTADQPGFNASKVAQFGYNASQDLQAIVLPYIASNAGTYMVERRFTFSQPKSLAAVQYVVDLGTKYFVAPPAQLANADSDYGRKAFIDGRLALFQSGTYSLPTIAASAKFDWGVARMPRGPAGAISVANGVAVAGNGASHHPEAVQKLLKWLGSPQGNEYLAKGGVNLPAVLAAQPQYFAYWKKKGIDVAPFFDATDAAHTVAAPGGADFYEAYTAAKPSIDSVFEGAISAETGLTEAEAAANAIMFR